MSLIDPYLFVARAPIPEDGFEVRDWVFAPPGRKPLVVRNWRGNPGRILRHGCSGRLVNIGLPESEDVLSPDDIEMARLFFAGLLKPRIIP